MLFVAVIVSVSDCPFGGMDIRTSSSCLGIRCVDLTGLNSFASGNEEDGKSALSGTVKSAGAWRASSPSLTSVRQPTVK